MINLITIVLVVFAYAIISALTFSFEFNKWPFDKEEECDHVNILYDSIKCETCGRIYPMIEKYCVECEEADMRDVWEDFKEILYGFIPI
jgi:hypothetical protein